MALPVPELEGLNAACAGRHGLVRARGIRNSQRRLRAGPSRRDYRGSCRASNPRVAPQRRLLMNDSRLAAVEACWPMSVLRTERQATLTMRCP